MRQGSSIVWRDDAVTGERHHVELGVLHDLEDALIFQDRLQQIERQTDRNLRHRLAAEIESVAARCASGT